VVDVGVVVALYLRDRRMKLAVVKYIHTPLGAGQPNKLLGKKS